MLPGVTVQHPVHGDGVVVEFVLHDKHNRPCKIRFDNGKLNHYSICSAAKLIGDRIIKQHFEDAAESRNATPAPMLLREVES